MNDHLEDHLRTALGHAAEHAPRAPGTLSARVVTRSRRRRVHAQALVAAAVVVLVAGGAGIAVRGTGTVDPAANPPPAPSAESTPGTPSPSDEPVAEVPDPVEKVWPEALWKIPAELPGGRKFQPQAFIDDHTLLLEAWKSFEKANAIYSYDLESHRVRKLADIRTPKGVFASKYTVGDGLIVWQTIDEADGDENTAPRTTKFWSIPVGGGEPTAIRMDRTLKGGADRLVVTGGKLAFSLERGGVFTVPLGGGTMEPVQGADRHHIVRWPWVGTPGRYAPDGAAVFRELFNAENGDMDEAVVRPGERNVRCGVTTCIGTRPDGRSTFFRLRDGSREREIPGQPFLEGLAADRFHAVHLPRPPGGQYLLDLATGRSGDLGLRPDADGGMISVIPGATDGRLVAYPVEDEYVIIDLARIDE
ncbi:hypothetical protein [Planomonospora venezuelensis]|uniref:Uncharacterized protein n=1 Tax=Planomonospora venezuelensis TaxID=1999 RepID=A0A841D4Z0_PLAVE|nr:hypothetical protein [Planomonospora venezuelensis]MBB5965311.1 hypothetical protein [Planomonospora venezuelensis]GIN00445.1 hypothetical protein Pve01_21030 [Planomonospora venezuelensis]